MLVGHVGKLVKVAAGIWNTHSRFGDARLETLAALAGAGRRLPAAHPASDWSWPQPRPLSRRWPRRD